MSRILLLFVILIMKFRQGMSKQQIPISTKQGLSSRKWIKRNSSKWHRKIMASNDHPSAKCQGRRILVLFILLSGDIELNPGPTFISETNSIPQECIKFLPVSSVSQSYICCLLKLLGVSIDTHKKSTAKPLRKPSKLSKMIGDGNCLFQPSTTDYGSMLDHTQIYHAILSAVLEF